MRYLRHLCVQTKSVIRTAFVCCRRFPLNSFGLSRYNKQKCSERLPKLIDKRELAHDYLRNISERPRQLSNYDLCLGQTDCDWHLPLIVRVHAHHLRNKRTRSGASQQNRQAAAQRRQASSSYGRNTGWYEEERWDAGPYQRHYPGWYGGD